MGSTLAGAMIEKLGILNLPMRKTGFSEYISGEYRLDSGVFQRRVTEQIVALSRPEFRGGVSVVDRDERGNYSKRTSFSRVQNDLKEFNSRVFDSYSELYSEGRRIFAKSLIYKDVQASAGVHVEYPIDFHRYSWERLESGLRAPFDQFIVIKMRRPFAKWLNSSVSQIFHSPPLNGVKSLAGFSLQNRREEYIRYNEAMDKLPGEDWEFDDLFQSTIEDKLRPLAQTLKIAFSACGDIYNPADPHLYFDLYGKMVRAERALTKFDDNVEFISNELQIKVEESFSHCHSMSPIATAVTNFRVHAQIVLSFLSYVWRGKYPSHRLWRRDLSSFRNNRSRIRPAIWDKSQASREGEDEGERSKPD